MKPENDATLPLGGRIADNIVYFARLLREAGLRPSPASVNVAIEAVQAIGIETRADFHAALRATLITRHEDDPVFDEAFRAFWRRRDLAANVIAIAPPEDFLPKMRKAGEARVLGALLSNREEEPPTREKPRIEVDYIGTTSESEVFRRMDFALMTAEELSDARRAIANLVMPIDEVQTRRFRSSSIPVKIDARAIMRHAIRNGGSIMLPRYREQKTVQPPLVILADISGSMSQYTRVLLHFMHTLAEKRRRVHAFLFGTRLTNITRQLRGRDPDLAVAACYDIVTDWASGTRIGETLKEFNRHWSRRVLGQGAGVLLITDGLERDDAALLEREMDRLHRSCRKLIWLNPLLRYEEFEARAGGLRAILPHVDQLRPVHNLEALADLVAALRGSVTRVSGDPRRILPAG
jgi:uncharacterized protein with von Willebrand factor type A (vWA) domain